MLVLCGLSVVIGGAVAAMVARRSWRVPLFFALADFLATMGLLGYPLILIKNALRDVSNTIDPASKARVMTERFAEASNAVACGTFLGLPGAIVAAVLLHTALARRARIEKAKTVVPASK